MAEREKPIRPEDDSSKILEAQIDQRLKEEEAVDLGVEGLFDHEKIDELVDSFENKKNEIADGVADLVKENEALVDSQILELGPGVDTLSLEIEQENARNELLGSTQTAAEELMSLCEEIQEETSQTNDSIPSFDHAPKGDLKIEPKKTAEVISRRLTDQEQGEVFDFAPHGDLSKKETAPINQERIEDDVWEKILASIASEQAKPTPLVDPEMTPVAAVEISPTEGNEFKVKIAVENSDGDETKIEAPLRSSRNVGVFNSLSTAAKRVFGNLYEDMTLRLRGEIEINGGQKLLAKSADKLHNWISDMAKTKDKISELQEELSNLNEMSSQMGSNLKPREARAVERSHRSLEQKINESENIKENLQTNIFLEEEKKARLQANLEASLAKFSQAIDKRMEPYQKKIAEMEGRRSELVAEKENFEDLVSGFESRLDGLRSQLENLEAVALPAKAKKSFRHVLNRKIKDIESALTISHSKADKLEDNIIKINGRLNKEELKIIQWEEVRGDLQERAQNKPELEREPISSGYTPYERLEFSEAEDLVPEFSPADYIDKWNSLSKRDGMILDKKALLAERGELTIKKLENKIKTIRFKGLNSWQLKRAIKEKTEILRAHFGLH